jgi:hypothetical protein
MSSYKCNDCGENFKRMCGLERHIAKSCLYKKILKFIEEKATDENKKEIIALCSKNQQSILENIAEDFSTSNSTIINDTTLNINSNNNIVIQTICINRIKEENTDYLIDCLLQDPDQTLINKICKLGDLECPQEYNEKAKLFILFDEIVTNFYELIHLNVDHPENHNIYISNKKKSTGYYMYYNRWLPQLDTKLKMFQINAVNETIYIIISTIINMGTKCQQISETQLNSFSKAIKCMLFCSTKVFDHIAHALANKLYNLTHMNRTLLKETYDKTLFSENNHLDKKTVKDKSYIHFKKLIESENNPPPYEPTEEEQRGTYELLDKRTNK